MKIYNGKDIKHSEIMQLIILHALYSLKESSNVYFQGGTAIRWCYSGSRFSEDLDFVTHLGKQRIDALISKMSEHIRRGMIAHFGVGEFEVRQRKTSGDTSFVSFFLFRPLKERKKVSVKVEFEKLKAGFFPQAEKMILSMLPFVRHLITVGEFRIPSPNSIILVETKEEILSDKIRALLERDYLKGRDFYDIWFLNSMNVRCDPELIKRKMIMYEAPFKSKREIDFFLNPGSKEKTQIIEAVQHDLSRFLSPQEISLFSSKGFKDIFDSLKVVFSSFKNETFFLSAGSKKDRVGRE
jgi:predicted nucleotidyltransferase component of viral defense system